MELLALLIEEDDENAELWYIMGVAALGASPPDVDTTSYHLEKAKELMEVAQERTGESCAEQLCMIDQHITQCDTLKADKEIAAEEEEDEEADI